ncbi:MAG: thiamine ABC transporter substrate binding subunit [Spirochaetaceae bacterium]
MSETRYTGRIAALIAAVAMLFVVLQSLSAAGVEESDVPPVEERRGETDELVIYAYDSLPGSLEDLAADHFESEYGVSVTFERVGDSGDVYTQAYLEREDPEADVLLGLDSSDVPRAREDGLLEPYEPSNLQVVDERVIVDDSFHAVPYDWGYIVLNVDTEQVDSIPQTWDDLLSSEYRDSIIMLNPGTSSPGRNFLLYTVAEFGPEGFIDYWRELRPNILTVTGGWSEGYGLYTEGEAPFVVSYELSPAYHREFEDSTRYDTVLIDDAGYLQVEVAGITRGATNRLNAERFIDFMVGETFQEEIPLSQFMYPVHPDVALPDSFGELDRISRPVMLDPREVAENFEEWLSEWEEVMQQ